MTGPDILARPEAYLCGLKKDAGERGLIGFDSRLVRALIREDIDCYYFLVVGDNRRAQEMFEKKTRFMETRLLQEYTTFILTPKFRLRTSAGNCGFRQATKADEAAVLFRRLPSVHFDTKLYTVRFFSGESKGLDETRLYPECGLL